MKKKKDFEINVSVIKQYKFARTAYDDMMTLCYGARTFNSYAGRGVVVCNEWRNDYGVFVKEMGERPDGASLERRDRNKGFNVRNCYWKIKDEKEDN